MALVVPKESDVHNYGARVIWKRGDEKFIDNRYSRRHEWSFDGGVTVAASSSPLVIPVPLSSAEAVDPEEALVASVSACHMLWFLYAAAKRGFVVDEYVDDASGSMGKNTEGRTAMLRIALRPKVTFSGEKRPSDEDLRQLHDVAHHECFIANSLKTEIVVEAPAAV
jgi:organic hydroperoxide reductase OsmC/OhrA